MGSSEQTTLTEKAEVGVQTITKDSLKWRAKWSIQKFHAADILRQGLDPESAFVDEILAAGVSAYEVLDRLENLLMFGGASNLWQCLIGNGTGTAGQTLTFFNNANAYIGVGDSTTAAVATQTDLQAAVNKLRKAMDATYPQHTDGVTDANNDIVFKSTFGTGDANFAWQEWGVFNGSSGGRMLNRKVESLGTKTSASVWAFVVTLTLA